MIRPSLLQMAELCGLSAHLSKEHPEDSAAAEEGREFHSEIAKAITTGQEPSSPEARFAVATFRGLVRDGDQVLIEAHVQLRDPETGAVITEGTPDLALVGRHDVIVVDWKTGGYGLPSPNDSLQLAAYCMAIALEGNLSAYVPVYVRLREREAREGTRVPAETWWEVLDRIRRAAAREREACEGPHCGTCRPRKHCPSWVLPAHQGPTELEPFTRPEGLTRDNAPRALRATQAMREMAERAEETIKAWVREHGPIRDGDQEWAPSLCRGRESGPSAKELREMGHGDLVRRGKDYERWSWRKVKD